MNNLPVPSSVLLEVRQLQDWIATRSQEFQAVSEAALERFCQDRPFPPRVIDRCVQLSEQLCEARRALAELTLVRAGRLRRGEW